MDLSIIIVNWNTRDLLAQCLDSVYAYPPAGAFEVIVVDNASTDGSVEMVRKDYPSALAIQNSANLGFAGANNIGIERSRGKYLLLLNSDAQLVPQTCSRMQRLAETDENIGIVGARLHNPDGTFQASYNDFSTLVSESLLALGLATRLLGVSFPSHPYEESQVTRACDWVPGACFLVRASAIVEVGGLDEGFFMYSEEEDWCHRMWRHGWKVYYCADAVAVHKGGQSSQRHSAQQLRLLYSSKIRYFAKHRGWGVAGAFAIIVRIAAILKAAFWFGMSLTSNDGEAERSRAASHLAVATRVTP